MGAKPKSDARFAFLRDPDLYDLIGRLALRMCGDEAFAEDIQNGAYVVAMELVLRGRGPKPGTERGWMCCVLRNHAHEEFRRRKKEAQPAKIDDMPEIPVEDQRTLHEHQLEVERERDICEKLAREHPEEVSRVLAGDGRTKEGADARKDDAERKRKERARHVLQTAFAVAAAAAIVFLVMRGRVTSQVPGLPSGAYPTLADASHELARRSCAAHEWVACLEELHQLGSLDASKLGPEEKAAMAAAVAGIRQQAFAHCASKELVTCLEELDTARRYDPEGDKDPSVTLARTEAQQHLQGSAAPAPSFDPDAKDVPKRHR
jgi:hypothetical protein